MPRGSTWETCAAGEASATITQMPRNTRKRGLRILPIQVRIFPGRREKNSAAPKKSAGEQQQIQPHRPALGKHLLQPHGEGGGGAAGNGEEGPDGEIQQAGEEHAVGLARLAGSNHTSPLERLTPSAATPSSGRPTARNQHARSTARPYTGCPPAGPCARGKNQIARPEKHAEEHAGHIHIFLKTQLSSSWNPPSLSLR